MPEKEELNQEETSEETTEETTEPEETTEETSEESSETQEQQTEYTKERFDGLMSSWQKDRKRMLELEEEAVRIKETKKPEDKEEAWIDYLDEKLQSRAKRREESEIETNRRERERVETAYPNLKIDQVIETAGKYGTDLATAAQVLQDSLIGQKTAKTVAGQEQQRKKLAGKIGGKPGAVQKPGLTKYDPNLSFDENVEKGLEELGEK
uniref:Scaffolding protein n=1 Tax=viral metagenome TaxID=1070528 RepID=A0A6H1ZW30_9ZZZZ